MLEMEWVPALEDGPDHWLDREWPWHALGIEDLHLEVSSEWLVIADELEQGATGELFGVLVTTGPVTVQRAGIDKLLKLEGELIWVEYIAIAPRIRPDCPAPQRRRSRVKSVGFQLMCAAIGRSLRLGLDGRIALHAEGPSAEVYTRWDLLLIGNADHRTDGRFPVFFGDAAWAARFLKGGKR